MTREAAISDDRHAAALTLRELERLGRELHDTLAPQLTALGMLAASLHERLELRSAAETQLAAKLLNCVEHAKADARSISRGLLPVQVDSGGLMSALSQLVEETQSTHGVICRFDCQQRVDLEDNFTATRLFRVASEAIHNAVKHAHASEIVLGLSDDDGLRLDVRDDGVGITKGTPEGCGLRMMRHRCQIVGGTFEVGPGGESGTLVTCVIPNGDSEEIQ
jgi:signal transduction histidine kinase